MSNASSAERTEKATPKRLKEAREKGKLANSRDLISWLAMAGAAVMIPLVATGLQSAVTESLLGLQTLIVTPTSSGALLEVGEQLSRLPAIVSPMLAGAVLGAVVGAMLQGGIHFKRFAPSFQHWNPISGIGRMFGKHALWEGAKALLKTAAVGGAIWIAIQGVAPLLASAGALPVQSIASVASGVLGTLLIAAIAAGLGVSTSRVSQLHSEALRTVRAVLAYHLDGDDGPPLRGVTSRRRDAYRHAVRHAYDANQMRDAHD